MSPKVSKNWGLKTCDRVLCTESIDGWFTEGKIYEVTRLDVAECAVVVDDYGGCGFPECSSSRFEVVKEDAEVDAKVSLRCGLKVGDKVRCKTLDASFLTMGRCYEVVCIDSDGDAVVTDDCGLSSYPEVDDWYFDLSEFGVESEHDAKRDRLEAAVFDEIASAKTQKDAFESGDRIMKVVLRAMAAL